METKVNTLITVAVIIDAAVEKVWNLWTDPDHIIHWNYASDDWYTPKAENDLRVGGRFLSRMEAKDGSNGFDFSGEYLQIEPLKYLEYVLDDGRNVQIAFVSRGNKTEVTETFEAEHIYPIEMQQAGWLAILENFKNYAETTG